MPDRIPSNTYTQRWFESFHLSIPEARTHLEVEFICSFAPLTSFVRIADVCCGAGRHTRALAERGYLATGIDRDPAIVAKARELGGGPTYLEGDLRLYVPDPEAYDMIIIMGQSYGHFDSATNAPVLQRLAAGLRDRGRIVLDLWNPDFFVAHQGKRELSGPEGMVHETKLVEDGRLFVHLNYPGGDSEDFEWELFTPEVMNAMVGPLGLRVIACCTDFDSSIDPCDSKPRIQFVLERT
ncbi:MAG: methyltransferase domain-containing protein [Verrucomicrobiaceae bacterium]|nr:MAG: methyltransferase domain-containing protein [Verrucomicrobiaceae bacterium]